MINKSVNKLSVVSKSNGWVLLIVICSLFTVSCDLFNGAKEDDLLKKMDEEVNWAAAKKLTVRLEFPALWGTSNPPVGRLSPGSLDIRQGYPFTVDFTPSLAYGLVEWRAYETSSLTWPWNDETVLAAAVPVTKGIEIPPAVIEGGSFTFKITSGDNITLVPYSKSQPKIYRRVPSDSTGLYPAATQIMIQFNIPINESTLLFGDDLEGNLRISIKDKDTEDPLEGYFEPPEYVVDPLLGQYYITIIPNSTYTAMLGGRTIEVTLGPGVKSLGGEPMTLQSFSYTTAIPGSLNGEVTVLKAECLEGKSRIKVEYGTSGGTDVKVYFREGRGREEDIAWDNDENYWYIPAVSGINADSVRQGTAVSGVQDYEITVEVYDGIMLIDRKSLRIWNIPGMSVDAIYVNTAFANDQSTLFSALAGAADNIILTDDIVLGSSWMPVNLTNRNIYGNGRTITVTGIGGTDVNRGLFGTAINSIIRDLTVICNIPSAISVSTGSGVTSIGGIVGSVSSATNTTKILNCIVSGLSDLSINATDGSSVFRLGGIAGYFGGSGKIENCRAALSLKYESSGHTGEINIGGIAGETGTGGTGNTITINNGYTLGTAAQGPVVTLQRLLIEGVSIAANVSADKQTRTGIINIGGAVGTSGQNTMNDVEFPAGIVSYYRNASNIIRVGGIVGNAMNTSIVDSSFSGIIKTINNNAVTCEVALGGLIGRNFIDAAGNYFINNCIMRGNIDVNINNNLINLGGALGFSSIHPDILYSTSIIITNTFFEEGNITVTGTAATYQIGGFTGWVDGSSHAFYNCGSLSGTIVITGSFLDCYVGGFISVNSGAMNSCFSCFDIIVDVSSENSSKRGCHVGGLLGMMTGSSSISNCYAAGTIYVIHNGDAEGNTEYFNINAGGLVGSKQNGTIQNSYALCNVFVDKQTGTGRVHSGGLVGWNRLGNISNCFSIGMISSKSNSGDAYAGGIAGYRQAGTISNNAALGPSAIVKTASARGAGRIYGYPITNEGSKNLSLATMVIGEDADYNKLNPATRLTVSDAYGPDGEDVAASVFYNQTTWTNSTAGLGFSATNWSFTRVGIDGHPKLAWE